MIRAKLDDLRRQLLDLSRRNRLLNFHAEGKRSLVLTIEDADELFQRVARDGEAFGFGAAAGEGVDGEGRLPTALADKALSVRLVHLGREARSAREEQGAAVLFLTFGAVVWEEDGVRSRAPLLFVPVELVRASVRSEHRLRRLAEDISLNPCLVELCRRRLRVDLPALPSEDELQPSSFVGDVRAALADSKWRVDDEVHLGLFSFHKFLMYRDLDPASWPDAKALEEHPLVRRLLGGELGSGGGEAEPAAPTQAPAGRVVGGAGDEDAPDWLVKDADASQAAAVLAVRAGRSFVLHGPPGTGKSQTITNVIADCLAHERSVLFVSEKSAALEVVQRRLTEVGLGRFVLALHSHRASKAAVLAELKQTLESELPRAPEVSLDAGLLREQSGRLDELARALHAPLGRLERSPYAAVLEAERLADAPELVIELPDVLEWSAERLERASERLATFDRRLERVGDLDTHPWRRSRLRSLSTVERQQVESSRRRVQAGLERLGEALVALAERWGEPAPADLMEAEGLLARTRTLLTIPRVAPERLADARWDAVPPRLAAWLGLGRECARLRARWREQLTSAVEDTDWSALVDRRRWARRSLLRLVQPTSGRTKERMR